MAAETVPEHEAVSLCAISETADPAEWGATSAAGALLCGFGVVCDPPRRGLQVEVRINRGHKTKRRTVSFGLWDTSTGGFVRIYQLTVADADSPTHSERGLTLFGAHEHMGDHATHLPNMDEASFDAALARFMKTVTLKLEAPLTDPMDPDKFSLK